MRWFVRTTTRLGLVVAVCTTALAQLSAQDLDDLRAQAERENWSFTISANPATEIPLEQLCGLVPPDNWRDMARWESFPTGRDLPARFDWRDSFTLPPARNQASCGSCWAFATVGPLECNIAIIDGVIMDLSEQWLVSCNTDGWGCGGGYWAHNYHLSKGDPCGDTGAVMEVGFPYIASDGTCGCPYTHVYWIEDWAYISGGTEAIKQAIYDHGPVTVGIYANSALQAYGGGIFDGCASGSVNHGVTLVGWDDNQGDAGVWYMRNSWGTYWGEDGGYCRIPYGCSIVGTNAAYIVYAGSEPPTPALKFSYPDGRGEVSSPAGSDVRVVVQADTDAPVPHSGMLYWSIDGAPYESTSMVPNGTNQYWAPLPAAACYSQIEWYVGARGQNSGEMLYGPADAPASVNTTLVATDLAPIFSDNFQTSQGWSVENGGGLTAGAWERGDPVGGGDRGDPADDYDGSGNCYLTGNADGDSDVDGGYTRLISPTIDLSGGDAQVTYALWYTNDFGGDPDNDIFYVHISNDNGSSWTQVDAHGPESDSGWATYTFSVSDFVTPTSTVKIRFEASDLSSGSVVEAGIDDVQVETYTCTTYARGDMNCDGVINNFDIHPFTLAVTQWYTYSATYPDCDIMLGDLNDDGLVNNFDIDSFVDLLMGG